MRHRSNGIIVMVLVASVGCNSKPAPASAGSADHAGEQVGSDATANSGEAAARHVPDPIELLSRELGVSRDTVAEELGRRRREIEKRKATFLEEETRQDQLGCERTPKEATYALVSSDDDAVRPRFKKFVDAYPGCERFGLANLVTLGALAGDSAPKKIADLLEIPLETAQDVIRDPNRWIRLKGPDGRVISRVAEQIGEDELELRDLEHRYEAALGRQPSG